MFHNIIEMCENQKEVSEYLHFAIQHLGKCYFDQQEYDVALQCFNDSLEIRKKIGDAALIESTQFAIRITKERIKDCSNVVQFPSSQFEGGNLIGPEDILNMVKMRVEGKDDFSIEDLNRELNQITLIKIILPMPHFWV